MTASTIISSEFTNISSQLSGSAWTVSEESVGGVSTAVLVRRSERLLRGQKSGDFDKEKFFLVKTDPSFARNTNGNSFRPSSPMGGQEWPGRDGRAIAASVSLFDGAAVGGVCDENASSGVAVEDGAVASPEVVFGDLPTVKAMGTGKRAPVIGFDTEFTYRKDGSRVIDSYQFSLIDPSDSDYRFDIVLLPLIEGERLLFESALCVVIRESGLWRAAGLPDARGFDRRDFWESGCDYGANLNALYKLGRLSLVLAGHYLNADLSAFARPHGNSKYADILRRVTSASGGLVSLQPVRVIERSGAYGSSERWLPLSVTIRDTMGQSAPGMRSLAVLGDSVGVSKIDVPGDWKERMSEYRDQHLIDFLEYGANDSVIVLEYLSAVWGEGVVPPVTLSGGGAHALRDGIKRYWGLEGMPNSLFMARFQGLMKLNEGEEPAEDALSYYAVRSLRPVDADAKLAHTMCKAAFHGGWNSALKIGYCTTPTYDHDIQSAYPSAMAAVVDVDYESGVVEEVIKDRELTLDDFPLGYATPLVAFVSWEFPEGVEPCIPVKVEQSVIYPRISVGAGSGLGDGLAQFNGFQGAYAMAPELLLALHLGARVDVQMGLRLRPQEVDGELSRSMRAAMKQMVEDRATAKRYFGKKSLEELVIKVASNSCYGKLAQDVSERSGWNAWEEEMESIGGSSVTSPYHAAMITSLVRALLLAKANEVALYSVTTDGGIFDLDCIDHLESFGLSDVFRDSREALVGDRTVWEIKHRQSELLNVTTRGNVSREPGGVLAKAGMKSPDYIERGSVEEREWFWDLVISRDGKVPNPYRRFPSFKELSRSRNRLDFAPVDVCPEVSLDFDFKRKPVWESVRADVVNGHEVAGFDTAPWESVEEYVSAKEKVRHIAKFRPGTTGDNRPTGCLRTVEQLLTLKKRIDASKDRRIYTGKGSVLTDLVAAHREGLIDVPMLASSASVSTKLDWLSSLGYGEFTRAQWDHLCKKDRRARVVKDLDLGELARIVEDLPTW